MFPNQVPSMLQAEGAFFNKVNMPLVVALQASRTITVVISQDDDWARMMPCQDDREGMPSHDDATPRKMPAPPSLGQWPCSSFLSGV